MSGKVLFACSKCFSRHPFEELSSGRQLCKNCRTPSTSTSAIKCTYCRSEFQPVAKSQNACKKCEHNLNKYGKPSACECCKVVAAFGGSKCMRCASYEAKYGAPVQCEECKLRSAFDKHDENKKVNGKVLCWLCTCAFKRAVLKAQQEGRIVAPKKRAHEKSHRDGAAPSAKKSARATADIAAKSSSNVSTSNAASLDLPEKIARSGSSSVGNAVGNGTATTASSVSSVTITPAAVNIDPNSADHVVQMTNLKERIASLEKRLSQKDKELLDKDKLLTELKGKNFEKEIEMRNKLKESDRIHEMKVENLNRKVAALLKEIATLKRDGKKKNGNGVNAKDREKGKRDNPSPLASSGEDKEESNEAADSKFRSEENSERESLSAESASNSPLTV